MRLAIIASTKTVVVLSLLVAAALTRRTAVHATDQHDALPVLTRKMAKADKTVGDFGAKATKAGPTVDATPPTTVNVEELLACQSELAGLEGTLAGLETLPGADGGVGGRRGRGRRMDAVSLRYTNSNSNSNNQDNADEATFRRSGRRFLQETAPATIEACEAAKTTVKASIATVQTNLDNAAATSTPQVKEFIEAITTCTDCDELKAVLGTKPSITDIFVSQENPGEYFEKILSDDKLLDQFQAAAEAGSSSGGTSRRLQGGVNSGLTFTGTDDDVKQECIDNNANCCVPNGSTSKSGDPCKWVGNATVSSNSCNGQGACNNIGEGLVIFENSCNGKFACRSVGRDASSSAVKTVGPNSCNAVETDDDDMCSIDGLVNSTVIQVAQNACQGDGACSLISPYEYASTDNDQRIGKGSCIGRGACKFIPVSVTVGENSCQGDGACTNLNFDAVAFVIGDNACTAEDSCNFCGNDSCDGTTFEIPNNTANCTAEDDTFCIQS